MTWTEVAVPDLHTGDESGDGETLQCMPRWHLNGKRKGWNTMRCRHIYT